MLCTGYALKKKTLTIVGKYHRNQNKLHQELNHIIFFLQGTPRVDSEPVSSKLGPRKEKLLQGSSRYFLWSQMSGAKKHNQTVSWHQNHFLNQVAAGAKHVKVC